MPSVGPGRGGKPLTGVDGPMDGWWNLQRVSLREKNRGRLSRVAEWLEQRGWDLVLVKELFGEGVI